jgi:hypothetical protein
MASTPNVCRIASADRAPLRIGLLLDSSDEISAFAARIIEDIEASNFSRIELLVVKQANAGRQAPGTRPDSPSRIRSCHARAGCLLLFCSASLTGDWQIHPANPISTDIRRNRGCQPSLSQSQPPDQAQADTVTGPLSNKIMELSRERHSERHVKTIDPEHSKGFSEVHYNCAGKAELSDGRSPAPLRRVLAPDGES